jgi:hypothetical protein
MRAVVLIAGLVFALVATAATAAAQFRGGLTSRPQVPSTGPRVSGPPLPRLPIWGHWSIGRLPEAVALDQPPLGPDAPTGGVQLDIQPWSAQVYVDGASVGRVEQFRGYYQHLTLPAGPHVIAVVAPDRDPLIFVVTVVPGRTVTQRATLSASGSTLP